MTLFETSRMLVRHMETEDEASLFELFGNPAVTKFMGDGKPLTRELCAKWIAVSQENYKAKGYGASAVLEKQSGNFVGLCGIIYDKERNEPEIIYAFDPKAWGSGYATELVPAMLDYGIESCRLKYVLATIDLKNLASWKVAKLSGMRCISIEVQPDGSRTLVFKYEPH